MRRYRVFFKDEQESPYPDEVWTTREGTEAAIKEFEEDDPNLKGKLEVREDTE